jgi:hypothetical protein
MGFAKNADKVSIKTNACGRLVVDHEAVAQRICRTRLVPHCARNVPVVERNIKY